MFPIVFRRTPDTWRRTSVLRHDADNLAGSGRDARGEKPLWQKLRALRGWHLRNIVRRYNLAHPSADLESMTKAQLVELIVAAVHPS
jgi:hypothetical protein